MAQSSACQEGQTVRLPYIQLYKGNASLLAESLEVIQQTANVILAALEPPVEEEVSSEELEEVAA